MKESSERIERSLDQVKSEFTRIRSLSGGGPASSSPDVDAALDALDGIDLDGDELVIPGGEST
jgi:hypothetical protein